MLEERKRLLEKTNLSLISEFIKNHSSDGVDIEVDPDSVAEDIQQDIKEVLQKKLTEQEIEECMELITNYTELNATLYFSFGIRCGGKLLSELLGVR